MENTNQVKGLEEANKEGKLVLEKIGKGLNNILLGKSKQEASEPVQKNSNNLNSPGLPETKELSAVKAFNLKNFFS